MKEAEEARKNRSWWGRLGNVKTEEVKVALRKEEESKQKTKELELKVTRDKGKKNETIEYEKGT